MKAKMRTKHHKHIQSTYNHKHPQNCINHNNSKKKNINSKNNAKSVNTIKIIYENVQERSFCFAGKTNKHNYDDGF